MEEKKVIAIMSNGMIYSKDGLCIGTAMGKFDDYKEGENKPETQADIAKLVQLGITPDELIKLKANGLL